MNHKASETTTFRIRDAEPGDLDAITEIYRESVLNGTATYEIAPPDRQEMARRFAEIGASGYPYIAAVSPGDELLGYAYASAFRTRPAYRWLVEDSIYLAPASRGRGVGRALLRELLTRCEAGGFRQMVAVIGGASPASVALHASLGFRPVGTMQGSGFKHGQWLDTVIMQIALGPGNETPPDDAGADASRT